MRFAAAFLSALLLIPFSAKTAEWSDEEQRFLEWQKSCWADDSEDTVERCFHDDYAGWGNGFAVPYNKADRNTMFANERTRTDYELIQLKPLDIRVMDDTAIMLYVVTYEITDRRSGESEVVTEKWTDVAVREGEAWQWIADHGETID